MIHLPNLRGYRNLGGIIARAVSDAKILAAAGYDGALIENYHDDPESEFVPEEVKAAAAVVASNVASAVNGEMQIGVQLLLNDYEASFAICKAAGASFSRVDVFVDDMTGRWGDIRPDTNAIIAARKNLCPELFLLADVQVKHKTMIDPGKSIETSTRQAVAAGASAVVATGAATGIETPMDTIVRVKSAAGGAPVIIGAGLNTHNAESQLSVADGAIVGTGIMTDGKIDAGKAVEIVRIRNKLV
jgi:membrane complex biogenesis BtpA family protein